MKNPIYTWIQHHPIRAACIGYFLVTVFFFFPTLFQGAVPLPTDLAHDYLLGEPAQGHNPYTRDALVQLYPYSDFIFDSYKQGHIPTFNPYIFNGMSFANGQSSAYSPVNLLIPLFNNSLSFFTATIVLYFFVSGLGMFLYLRKEVHPLFAFAAGLAWQLSGPMIMWLSWGTIDGVLAFFPLTLWAVRELLHSGKWHWRIAVLLCNYAMLTAGHTQFYLYALTIVLAYAAVLIWPKRKSITKRHIGMAGSWLLLNTMLIFAFIHPFLAQSELSHRIQSTNTSHLSLHHLFLWLFPNYWGDVTHFIAPLNYLETAVYVGMLPVLFFLSALTLRTFWRTKETLFWIFIAGGVALYMFFPQLFKPLAHIVPMLATVPPFRAVFVLSFVVIIIAIRFLHWTLQQKHEEQKKVFLHVVLVAGTVLLCVIALLGVQRWGNNLFKMHSIMHASIFIALIIALLLVCRWKRVSIIVFSCVCIVLMGIDQWMVFHNFNAQQSRDPLTHPPEYIAAITTQKENALIYSELSPFNMYSVYGIRSLFGYDSTYPQEYFKLIKQHGEILSDHNILNARISDIEFLRTLQVDYIVSKREFDLPVLFQENDIRVYTVFAE